MPAIFKKGDIFGEGLKAFAQGCNCAGSMDSGIAVAFKKRWPRMEADYRARCADGRFHLGDVFVWSEEDTTVFNIGIQENWKQRATMAALSRGMKRTLELAVAAGIERIGVPRIGAGLGGLEWPRVRSILTEVSDAAPVTLVVFEQFIRSRPDAEPESD